MAHIIFFEKPGCINNTKQKTWLEVASHTVEAHSILEHPWKTEELRSFLPGDKPAKWFNRTAPAIKNGKLDPDSFNESNALAILIETPILIKRPLMQIDQIKLQGFDKEKINLLIGLSAAPGEEEIVEKLNADNLMVCPKIDNKCD
ncbi:MAG: ArsC/Spx/MgsR family protein [Pontiella sp.]